VDEPGSATSAWPWPSFRQRQAIWARQGNFDARDGSTINAVINESYIQINYGQYKMSRDDDGKRSKLGP
jgi:hypothetical protein